MTAGGAATQAPHAREGVLCAHAVVGVLVALDRFPEELARAVVLAEGEPRAARPVEQSSGRAARRAAPCRGLELLGRFLEARGAVLTPAGAPGRALRVTPVRVLREQPPPPGCGAVVERVLLVMVRERQQRFFAPRCSREAVGDRQVGFRGARTARAVGRETERGLGRVRRCRADLEQHGAALGGPPTHHQGPSQSHAREVGFVGGQARELDGAQAIESFAGTPRAEQGRAALQLQARALGCGARRQRARKAGEARVGLLRLRREGVLAIEAVESGRGCRPVAPGEIQRAEIEQGRRRCVRARRRGALEGRDRLVLLPRAGQELRRFGSGGAHDGAARLVGGGERRGRRLGAGARASYAREVASRAWSRSKVLSMSEWR